MKRILFLSLLLWSSIYLLADPVWQNSVALRPANDLRYKGSSVSTATHVHNVWIQSLDGNPAVMWKRINMDHPQTWDSTAVVKTGANIKTNAKCVLSSDNRLFITWMENVDGGRSMLYAQKFSAVGDTLWTVDGVQVFDSLDSEAADYRLVADQSGGLIILVKADLLPRLYAQKLSSAGTPLWDASSPISTGVNPFAISSALGDGAGGLLAFYRDGTNNVLQRFNENGQSQWQQSYPQVTGEVSANRSTLVTNTFNIIDIVQAANTDTRLYIRSYNLSGTLITPQAVQLQINPEEPTSPTTFKASISTGTNLSLMVSRTIDTTTSQVLLFKYLSGLQNLLDEEGLVISETENQIELHSILAASSTREMLLWEEFSGSNSQLKAQLFDVASGTLWNENGSVIASTSSDIHNAGIFLQSNRWVAVFGEKSSHRLRLKAQVIDNSGNQLHSSNGFPLEEVLTGKVTIVRNLALNDRNVVFFYDNTIDGIYTLNFQLINDQGNILLADTGNSIVQSSVPNTLVSAIALPNNQFAVLYKGQFTYLQLYNAQGVAQWAGNGLHIVNAHLGDMKLDYDLDQIFVAWMEAGASNTVTLKGQCILNGQKLWGTNGIVIQSGIPASQASICASAGRYFVWQQLDTLTNELLTKALLMNPSGSPAPGFEPSGSKVIWELPDNFMKPYFAHLHGTDLILVFTGMAPSRIIAQRLTHNNSYPWGIYGIQVLNAQAMYLSTSTYASGLAMLFVSAGISGAPGLYLQKLDLYGNMLLPYPGTRIDNGAYPELSYPQLASFANGSFAAVWTAKAGSEDNDKDLFYRYLNAEGSAIGTQPRILCNAPRMQDYARMASRGNTAIVSWMDTRTGASESIPQLRGIYAQMLNISAASVDPETHVPALAFGLNAAYPNPFGNTLNLKWSTKEQMPIKISVYNIRGQKIKQLFEGYSQKGDHELVWHADNDEGKTVAPGLYIIKAQSNKQSHSIKAVKY